MEDKNTLEVVDKDKLTAIKANMFFVTNIMSCLLILSAMKKPKIIFNRTSVVE